MVSIRINTVIDAIIQIYVLKNYLQQTLGILRVPGGDDLKTGNGTVPGSKALGVLGSDTGSGTVGATEGDGASDVTAGHVVGLGGRVDDLINGLNVEKCER